MRLRNLGRADLLDAAFALALFAAALLGASSLDHDSSRDPDTLYALLAAAQTLPVVRRRHEPVVVALLVAAATAAIWIADYNGTTALSGVVVTYSLGAYAERGRALRAYAAIALVLLPLSFGQVLAGQTVGGWSEFVARVAIVLGPFWAGDSRRARQELLVNLRERAERAEADREQEAIRAVAEERSRIARDLHDVVAHSLSVMVVHATAAERLVTRDPGRAGESIATVAATGREALTEMRRILGVLDGAPATAPELAPQPRLADLDALVARCRDGGMDITVELDGPSRDLAPGVELAIYRVVQEALTNVIKHAGPAQVALTLDTSDPAMISVSVTDDGRGPLGASTGDGAGRGLIGMQQRIESVGGTLHTGARRGGGFLVAAEIPLPAPTAAAGAPR